MKVTLSMGVDRYRGSLVASAVAVRLADYLSEIDASSSRFLPLAERLPYAAPSLALERRRIALVLDWGVRVVEPATTDFLNMTIDNSVQLLAAGRDVRHELTRARHIAHLDSTQARDLTVGYVWNAVFCAFTHGHTRPLLPAVLPVLLSAHELLARLIDLTDPTDAAVDAWVPVTLALSSGGSHATPTQ
jgi:hypothetical protein